MFSPGQRLLLRSGEFAQFVCPVFRLDGQVLEVALANGSARLVNVKDVMVTDWSGIERRRGERRHGERRQVNQPIDAGLDLRKQLDRRKRDRRQFAITRKMQSGLRRR